MDEPDLIVCDLDGVVWLGGLPIDGSVEAVRRLRRAGRRVLFVTNSSAPTIGEHTAALAAIGIAAAGDVVSSSTAVAELITAGERVLVSGGAGVAEAVTAAGGQVIGGDDDEAVAAGVDVIVAGFHLTFDYHRLQLATTAVRAGARFVATNRDPLFPMPLGPIPGAGSIVAAIATATGVEPTTAGKPHAPMCRAVLRQLGIDAGEANQRMLVVGDQLSSDGRFADALGCRFALVRTGNTPPGAAVEPTLDFDVGDLAAVATAVVGGELTATRSPLTPG